MMRTKPEIHCRLDQSDAMHNRTHSYGVLLLVSIAGAFITALAFIVVAQFSLPPTDLAYGQSIATTLRDPFVRTIAGPVAFVSGLLTSPLLYFCLRRRRLAVTLPIVFGSVLTTVALITPFSQSLGFFSAYAALIISCIVCTRMKIKLFHLPGIAVALLLIALVVSCASNQPQAITPEPATIPTHQGHSSGVGKDPDAPATNSPSAKQKLTGAEVVEIVRQHVVKAAPAAKFEIGSPQFSAGKWSVFVDYLPFGPGRHVYYELSAKGEILGRRGGY